MTAEANTESYSRFHLVDFPRVHDPRGDLTFIEGAQSVPFDIARVYFTYNVPVDAERGGHAHADLEQVIIALSGSFRVTVDDGRERRAFWLRDPGKGLYIGSIVWREIDSFSQGAVQLVLASRHYDEADYFRDYGDFLRAVEDKRA